MHDELTRAIADLQRCIEQRDVAAAASVLDEEYSLLLVQRTRATMPRDRWLETLADYIVHEYAVEEQIVDVDGDLAVVLHRDRMRATVLGIDRIVRRPHGWAGRHRDSAHANPGTPHDSASAASQLARQTCASPPSPRCRSGTVTSRRAVPFVV